MRILCVILALTMTFDIALLKAAGQADHARRTHVQHWAIEHGKLVEATGNSENSLKRTAEQAFGSSDHAAAVIQARLAGINKKSNNIFHALDSRRQGRNPSVHTNAVIAIFGSRYQAQKTFLRGSQPPRNMFALSPSWPTTQQDNAAVSREVSYGTLVQQSDRWIWFNEVALKWASHTIAPVFEAYYKFVKEKTPGLGLADQEEDFHVIIRDSLKGRLLQATDLLDIIPIDMAQEIQSLDLSDQALGFYDTSIKPPRSLNKLCNIQWLNLSYNFLDRIPGVITRYEHLIDLDLSANDLSREDALDGIDSLKRLRHLKISDNDFLQIPEVVWELASLTILDISGNENLESLSPNIQKLTNLEEFSLGDHINPKWECGPVFTLLKQLDKLRIVKMNTPPLFNNPDKLVLHNGRELKRQGHPEADCEVIEYI